jgi:hypothetical protein
LDLRKRRNMRTENITNGGLQNWHPPLNITRDVTGGVCSTHRVKLSLYAMKAYGGVDV